MTLNPEDFPDLVLEPLEDRIFNMVGDLPTFNFKVIRKLFPEEGDRAIYRALNKLEESGRIKMLFWANRMKHYSTMGTSKLPIIQGADGKILSIGQLFPHTSELYEGQQWKRLKEANTLPLVLNYLFVNAAELEGKELKDSYIDAIHNLQKMRENLTLVINWIDAVLKHPTMRGNVEQFKLVFTSKEAPTPQQMTDFKVWLSRNFAAKEINNEGSEDTQS